MEEKIFHTPPGASHIGKNIVRSTNDIRTTGNSPIAKLDPLILMKASNKDKYERKPTDSCTEKEIRRPKCLITTDAVSATKETNLLREQKIVKNWTTFTKSDHAMAVPRDQSYRRSLTSMGLQVSKYASKEHFSKNGADVKNESVLQARCSKNQRLKTTVKSSSIKTSIPSGSEIRAYNTVRHCDGDAVQRSSVQVTGPSDLKNKRLGSNPADFRSAGILNKTGSSAWDVWCARKREEERLKREAKKREEAILDQKRLQETNYEKECEKENYRSWLLAKEAQERKATAQKILTGTSSGHV